MFWKEILILLGALALFFGTFFLNRRIKVPEGTKFLKNAWGAPILSVPSKMPKIKKP